MLPVLCCSCLVLASCAGITRTDGTEPGVLIVSFIDLLGHPERYDGKKIEVKGYLSNGYLYLTRDHAEISHDIAMSIYIVEPTEDGAMTHNCSNAYGSVEGVFDAEGNSLMRGRDSIDLVDRVTLFTPDPVSCWPDGH